MGFDVLIVDDSQTMRKVIRKSVAISGFDLGSCWEASNGAEALDIVHSQKVDVILSDFNMPGMNGLEMARELHKDEKYRQIPILFISAQDNPEVANEGKALGIKGYIQKPFRPEEIRDLLQRTLEKPNAG